jgi:hypothetical protein
MVLYLRFDSVLTSTVLIKLHRFLTSYLKRVRTNSKKKNEINQWKCYPLKPTVWHTYKYYNHISSLIPIFTVILHNILYNVFSRHSIFILFYKYSFHSTDSVDNLACYLDNFVENMSEYSFSGTIESVGL